MCDNEVMSCVLCSGLLPRGEDEVVEQHMKEQHRVFTNLPLVVGTSRLEVGQLEQFMGVGSGSAVSALSVLYRLVSQCRTEGFALQFLRFPLGSHSECHRI